MQTIWHDSNGRVKAVYDGGTTSTVWDERGYTKAVSDPKKNGRLTQDHVVTSRNGVVESSQHDPIPPNPQEVQKREELARIPELRESILDQIAMGETPKSGDQTELKALLQKHR